jgi:hypothetical protein
MATANARHFVLFRILIVYLCSLKNVVLSLYIVASSNWTINTLLIINNIKGIVILQT